MDLGFEKTQEGSNLSNVSNIVVDGLAFQLEMIAMACCCCDRLICICSFVVLNSQMDFLSSA